MARYMFVVACLFMATISSCVALDYTVGDSAGWELGVDFASWSAGKIFNVGDNLVFKYGPGHTVAEVNLRDYTACVLGDGVISLITGSTRIPLETPGTHYFLCTGTGHCDAGMKLAITVSKPRGLAAITSFPTSPAGGSATPLSYGTLAVVVFLLVLINQY